MMKKNLVWLSILVTAAAAASAAENLALGKSCAFSHEPNYRRGTEPGDATDLTDGKFVADGRMMWLQPGCVGWMYPDQSVAVTLDLGRVEPLAGFSWNCAGGCSGVTWPDFVNVYVSTDGKTWTFVGDLLARSFKRTGPPPADRYGVYRAFADDMSAVGRYVKFTVYNTWMRFVDEIEVFRGPDALLADPSTGFTTDDPLRHDGFLRSISPVITDMKRLTARADKVLPAAEAAAFRADMKVLRKPVGRDDGTDPFAAVTTVPLSPAHADVLALHARLLRAQGFGRPCLWKNDRWENLDPLAVPTADEVAAAKRLSVEMMCGETRATAVNVLNPTDRPLPCVASLEGFPRAAQPDCREVVFTVTKIGECVSGALRPGDGKSVRFEIPAGCSKQVWLSFAKPVCEAGTYAGRLRVALGEDVLETPVDLAVHDLDFPERPRLHVGGWDDLDRYLRDPSKRALANANRAAMREIFRDVAFATHRVIPKGAKFDADGKLLNPDGLDLSGWDDWTAEEPDARLFAVFVNGGPTFEGEKLGTPRFNRMVREFYAAWAAALVRRGVSPERVVLHLVDEVKNRAEDERLIAWAKAVRSGAPGFRLFTDPIYEDPTTALPESYSACDIICPQVRYMDGDIGRHPSARFFMDIRDRERKTLWLYSCSGPARTLDPITYFRGIEWLAWQVGAKGVGFWQFGCGGGIDDSWHAWRQTGREYSPYFVSPTGTMNAKQSEGIREGVEDYEYLAMLADAVAKAKAGGRDVAAAERLLAEAPARALNQVGRPDAALTIPDSDEWKDPKPRDLMDRTRAEVLRALAALTPGGRTFDTASAWVTGTRFAFGANRDRKSPPPKLEVRFRLKDGTEKAYPLGEIVFKNLHYLQHRFTPEELRELDGARLVDFGFSGLTDEDKGIRLEKMRLFTETFGPIATVDRPQRNLEPMKGQDLGNNVGAGRLPFPVRERTIQPLAASAKPALGLLPRFGGGTVKPEEAPFLEVKERCEGRVLVVDLFAPAGKVTEITLGSAVEAPVSRLIRVPYLPGYGKVSLLEGGLFRSAWVDWYRSNASEVMTNAVGSVTLVYRPKTDGTYNPVCERVVVTLSDEFADVLPEIPNPPSPYRKLVGGRLWRSHAASDRARDKAFWRLLHGNGIRNVCVMDHETMWRDGGEAFTMTSDAAKGRGGDAAQKDFTRFMNGELGYVYGPYNNFTDYQPSNARWWSVDRVSRNPDGSLAEAWLRSYAPKATAILPICERMVPELQSKFGFRGAYCDVHTAVRPWDRTDYDARCPGAGTFSQVYYAWGELLLRQRTLFGGPIWSEGGNHFMFAGLADGNYAQDYFYDFGKDPWIVDFDLLKVHPLEVDFGMGSLSMFSHPRTEADAAFYLPGMPEGRDRLVDAFIAATLAYGHAGLLIADWCWKPAKMFGPAYCGASEETFADGLGIAKRSYFMVQAIAARYAGEAVEEIAYFDAEGKAQGTSAAFVSGAIGRRQVYVRYTGGVHVVVNGHPTERLHTTVGGIAIDLPSYGYRCWTDDGKVLVVSDDDAGKGPRHDYAKGPDYTYDDRRK